MAEAVGLAASVIAIIDLSAKVAKLCSDYSTAVRSARDDITRFQSQLGNLGEYLKEARRLLDDPNSQSLTTSRRLVDSLDGCTSELVQVQTRLDPGKARKTMRRFGLRALRWPFDSKEVNGIIANLERYNQTIMRCLQIDQTTILLNIQQKFEGVSLQPRKDKPIARKPYFCVPFDRDPDFIDRPDILTWLEGQYTGSASRMALVGMGGFGKSQVAIQFAHHIHDKSPQTSVFWVHASSKPRFEEAYRFIAQRLELPRRNDPDIDVLGLVRDWLQTEEAGSWLMVLDNVDDVNLCHPSANASGNKAANQPTDENAIASSDQRPLAAYLPKCRSGTILVTSRSMDAAEKLTSSQKAIYRISTMDDTQGLQLFRNKLNGDFDRDTAADLLRALDCIPLAITQAAAYINRRAPRASVKTYLDAFRESDKKKGSLLNRDAGDLRRDETVSNSVVTTWQVTFDQINRERPSAAKLLSFMSFFNPQGIPEFVLHDYSTDLTDNVDRDADSDDFEDDLDVLRGYSLVSVTAAQDVCEVHSLVQFCTRAWISMDDAERWRQVFLRSMSRHFPSGAFETWPTCQLLLPHIESVLEEKPPDEDLQNWACLLTSCAYYMLTVGNYTAAEKLGRKAVEIRAKVLGEEHPSTLASMANLASTFWNQGRWKEAEELEAQELEICSRVLGEEHPDTLASMANLASTFRKQGRWKEAEELQAQELEICSRVLGEEHPSTLTSMANLASTFSNQGRWKEAEELEVGVMETRKRVLGEEHPDTLTSMANLASTFMSQGRWKEAEKLQVGVVETMQRVLGEEHPDTLTSMANLASTFSNQGRWKEAEELGVGVMETRKRVLGEEHPDTLMSMNNLALTFWNQGRWKEAEELGVGVMETRKRVLGEEHPDTLTSMNNLASTFSNQGRWKEAEELEVGVIETTKRVLGEEHPDTLMSMANLASTFSNQGRWKEAEELEVGVMETRKRVLGEEHPDTLTSMNNLASTFLDQGRWKEAEELQVGVIETRKRVLGEEHPSTLTSMANLAITWKYQDRTRDALALMRSCVLLQERVLGIDHPHTASSVAVLAQWENMSDLSREA
ncbi:hypothetical protein NCS57_00346200 [Fusarium keratoplasticum]|uniref:Uncharacterized protein n=1 Tax=Fusarium keratoplasticum TaxID=1328300 RepID=A0ACC0R2J0_9HYPO|nr:hypothetical protein NCS57_00346200 [Fusarium keratoplasticum]KAI8674483.1 hypothetical protein NCS57_00346200 [Fusarium keratoplasticum]